MERSVIRRRRSQEALPEKRPEQSRLSKETSPSLSYDMKESISRIVRGALKPHWRSRQITSQQYEAINRDVSRKLYDEVAYPKPRLLNEDSKDRCEKIATREVARAVSELTA